MAKNNIEKHIYGDFGRFYDFLGWNKFAKVCAERLKNFIAFRGDGKETVLDLACGTGELEYLLRKSKLNFTGVDISYQMLSQARGKTPKVKYFHADMTDVRLNEAFDIVVCFFDSVNHLNNLTEVRRMFKTARIHLKPGGYFIFDMLSAEGLEGWEAVDVRKGDDYYVTINGNFYPEKIMAEATIEGFVKVDGDYYERFCQHVVEHSYPFKKIADSLTMAGFRDISVTSFDLEEQIDHTSRWFFVVS